MTLYGMRTGYGLRGLRVGRSTPRAKLALCHPGWLQSFCDPGMRCLYGIRAVCVLSCAEAPLIFQSHRG